MRLHRLRIVARIRFLTDRYVGARTIVCSTSG